MIDETAKGARQRFYGVKDEAMETDISKWPIGIGPFRTPLFDELGLVLASHESAATISTLDGEVGVCVATFKLPNPNPNPNPHPNPNPNPDRRWR